MTVAIGGSEIGSIKLQLAELMREADAVDMAVSYVQVSGWKEIAPLLKGVHPDRVRIVCTDQLGITDPRAVRMAQEEGIKIRRYTGATVFHPKLYLSSKGGGDFRYMLGSANLSASALNTSVECVASGADENQALHTWFDGLFDSQSEEFTEEHLIAMLAALRARVKGQFVVRTVLKKTAAMTVTVEASSSEALEPLFAALPEKIGLLNFDHGGNTVRNLQKALEWLKTTTKMQSKQSGEMEHLGFGRQASPTALWASGASQADVAGLAKIWTAWLKHAPEQELLETNPNELLIQARRTYENFWQLDSEVVDYFLINSEGSKAGSKERYAVQTIELLSNVGPVANTLSISDVLDLSETVRNSSLLPPEKRSLIEDYIDNKGTRSWQYADRRLLALAYRDA